MKPPNLIQHPINSLHILLNHLSRPIFRKIINKNQLKIPIILPLHRINKSLVHVPLDQVPPWSHDADLLFVVLADVVFGVVVVVFGLEVVLVLGVLV